MPSYEAEKASFEGLNAQVLGISVDHVPCIQAWAESLGGISFPLLSDFWPHGAVADLYGVLRSQEGHSERAIFVIDKRGYIRYVDIHNLDSQPDNEVLRKVIQSLEPPSVQQVAFPARPSDDEELPTGEIIIYCARWCKDCRKARAWFEERGLQFVEVDIDYNLKARAQVRQWADGAIVTPTFNIQGSVVLDFNVPKLEEALRKAGKL